MEAGKKAAASVLEVRKSVYDYLQKGKLSPMTAKEIALAIGCSDREAWVYKILENLVANHPEPYARESGAHTLADRFVKV